MSIWKTATDCRRQAADAELQAAQITDVKTQSLSVVPDAYAKGNIKKLPLISHKAAANKNDAFAVLIA